MSQAYNEDHLVGQSTSGLFSELAGKEREKMKLYIIDVHLCIPDQSYYPLSGRSKYTELCPAQSLDELMRLLESDRWKRCGMVLASDGRRSFQMLQKKPSAAERYFVNGSFIDPKDHLIAVAEE